MSVESNIRTLSTEVFDKIDLTSPSPTVHSRTRSAAFIVLAHAEIEFAIEQECLEVAKLLESATEPATAMLAWGFASIRTDGKIQNSKSLFPIDELVEIYRGVIKSNHGIKNYHLEALLLPIGIRVPTNDPDIQAIHSLGLQRGPLAHATATLWSTMDAPSTHVTRAIQAGQSADRLIASIKATHSSIRPRPKGKGLKLRARVARLLRRLARKLD